MTEPPPTPPPDPTSGAPPHPTHRLPPTYYRGSAPVEQPAFQPVTAIPAYAEPPRRRSTALTVGLVIAAVAVLVCGLCGVAGYLVSRGTSGDKTAAPAASADTEKTPTPTPTAAGHRVVYEVSGGGKGTTIVTYATSGGAEPDQVDLPWRKEITIGRDTFVVMVFALQFRGGSMTCRVLVDGEEITKHTADNAVTCTHVVAG